ncbi:MAG: DUF58 domain-containing protein [Planctomycetota bacterium]|nr:DUF58 domain-containing protein [Planctomycetota bacterium]
MSTDVELFPDVRFDPSFTARAESCVARSWRRRTAYENAGRAWIVGVGDDLAGSRAYRPGDDPRTIDWNASARSDRPIVRVLRRSRGGSEVVALDASRSMAIGPPGKLQRAAEIAAALALLAVRGSATATVIAFPSRARFELAGPNGFRALLAGLEGLSAAGRVDWAATSLPRCDSATWIGDLAGASPATLARFAPRGTALRVVQVLAPHEVDPRLAAPTVLLDPESGERLTVGPSAIESHAHELQRRHESLRRELARRGARLVRCSSSEPFEVACARLLHP